ncbi:hypothetical protein U1Q18_029735 [Sarracenia purpurea var. burkii]
MALCRLAIHLQHLSNIPVLLQNKIQDAAARRGSEELGDDRFFEPVQWKRFSHVCTAPMKYDPKWASNRTDVSYIVTGAQLHVKKHDSKTVLHLRLLFSGVVNSCVAQSSWAQTSSAHSQKSGFFSAISTSISGNGVEKEKRPDMVVVDSSIYPVGPPVPVSDQKLLKFVDMSQLCRGPLDSPGHWLVTGARLNL